jgi:cyclic-di-GMP phosphodiesterase TipF (flagellum assembly factor)
MRLVPRVPNSPRPRSLVPRRLAVQHLAFGRLPYRAPFFTRIEQNHPGRIFHPADLSDLLGRFGIDLIVDRIEHESSVIDLLDYDVRYGQGSLFSPPRPVRAEALQANPGLPDAATGERSARANQLMPMTSPARNANPSMPETDNAEPSTVA